MKHMHMRKHLSLACEADCIKYLADESATTSGSAAAAEAAATPDDSFCQLFGANLSRDTQCLDDWRLQLLELLPAAGIQLTDAQVCKAHTLPSGASFPIAAFVVSLLFPRGTTTFVGCLSCLVCNAVLSDA